MPLSTRTCFRVLLTVLTCASFPVGWTEPAQSAPPRLDVLFPPGVTAGSRDTWTFRGRNLNRVNHLLVEGEGVSAVLREATDHAVVFDATAKLDATPGFRDVWLIGSDGVSDVRTIRVDTIPQTVEREPNDTPDQATPIRVPGAGVGTLQPRDLDHFRFHVRKGMRLVIEVEARRLGTPIAPVATVMTEEGRALGQGRETLGIGGDCRFTFEVPATGDYLVQVRDNLYGGSDEAVYRVRVSEDAFATGLFPLGGPPRGSLRVTASGGNLDAPIHQTVALPDEPGAIIDLPPFAGPDGPVLAPGRVVVGDGPERVEKGRSEGEPVPLALGETLNGRIDRPGEVDRVRVAVKKGQAIRLAVVASPLGSWLDSVLEVRDGESRLVAENDDAVGANAHRARNPADDPETDSAVEWTPEVDGDLIVSLSDRYGRGGPEYAYRLSVGPPRPDFGVPIVLRGASAAFNTGGPVSGIRPTESPDGLSSLALNLTPSSAITLRVALAVDPRVGPITLRVDGLPPGVTADRRVVRTFPRPAGLPLSAKVQPIQHSLILKAGPEARPSVSWLKVVASAEPEPGRFLQHPVEFQMVRSAPASPVSSRPALARRATVPLVVTDAPEPAR